MQDVLTATQGSDWANFATLILDYRLVIEIIGLVLISMLIGYWLGRLALKRRDSFQTQVLSSREKYWRRRVSNTRTSTERQTNEKARKLRLERRRRNELRPA
ncbi:MAG: hypothetical protein AAFV69_02250 [Pseudomonadota bacterium]